MDTIKEDKFGEGLIEEAIREKKKGYSVIENKPVTLFWERYYDLVEKRYPMLNIKKHERARGSNACWPIFVTPVKSIWIYHKSNMGYIDLTLPGLADKYFEVYDLVKDQLTDAITLQKASKSLAIRINVPKISFKGDFDEQIEQVNESLDAIYELQNFMRKIDCEAILNLNK